MNHAIDCRINTPETPCLGFLDLIRRAYARLEIRGNSYGSNDSKPTDKEYRVANPTLESPSSSQPRAAGHSSLLDVTSTHQRIMSVILRSRRRRPTAVSFMSIL